jgi:hypothetical protein
MGGKEEPHTDIYKEIINGLSHDAVCLHQYQYKTTKFLHAVMLLLRMYKKCPYNHSSADTC